MSQNGVEWETIDVGGQPTQALNMGDSAAYLGISQTALNNLLKRMKDQGEEIKRHERRYGRQRYLTREDLEKLRSTRGV